MQFPGNPLTLEFLGLEQVLGQGPDLQFRLFKLGHIMGRNNRPGKERRHADVEIFFTVLLLRELLGHPCADAVQQLGVHVEFVFTGKVAVHDITRFGRPAAGVVPGLVETDDARLMIDHHGGHRTVVEQGAVTLFTFLDQAIGSHELFFHPATFFPVAARFQDPLEAQQQFTRLDGFMYKIKGPLLDDLFKGDIPAVTGHNHYIRIRLGPDSLQQLEPVQIGHAQVGENDIDLLVLHARQGLGPAFGSYALQPFIVEQGLQHPQNTRIIINYQDMVLAKFRLIG